MTYLRLYLGWTQISSSHSRWSCNFSRRWAIDFGEKFFHDSILYSWLHYFLFKYWFSSSLIKGQGINKGTREQGLTGNVPETADSVTTVGKGFHLNVVFGVVTVHGVYQYIQGCQLREEVGNQVQVALIQLAAEVAGAQLLCVIAITKLERPVHSICFIRDSL